MEGSGYLEREARRQVGIMEKCSKSAHSDFAEELWHADRTEGKSRRWSQWADCRCNGNGVLSKQIAETRSLAHGVHGGARFRSAATGMLRSKAEGVREAQQF